MFSRGIVMDYLGIKMCAAHADLTVESLCSDS